MLTEQKRRLQLSGSSLKLIAIIIMTIDHFGAVIVEQGLLNSRDLEQLLNIIKTDYGRFWYTLDMVLRTVGRLAFPIFCFLLIEGFLHTRDAKRYLLNLSAFALLSEIPFDLAMSNTFFDFSYQNVFFTLAVGLLTLICIKRYEENKVVTAVITLGGCVLAILLRTDYSFIGILMIVFFYVFRKNRKHQFISAGLIAVLESLTFLGAAVLALIPISLYNGEKGRLKLKYGFYLYYPLHLWVFYLIRYTFLN